MALRSLKLLLSTEGKGTGLCSDYRQNCFFCLYDLHCCTSKKKPVANIKQNSYLNMNKHGETEVSLGCKKQTKK